MKINDIMHTGREMPTVQATALLRDVLLEMSRKGLGMAAIIDGEELKSASKRKGGEKISDCGSAIWG